MIKMMSKARLNRILMMLEAIDIASRGPKLDWMEKAEKARPKGKNPYFQKKN